MAFKAVLLDIDNTLYAYDPAHSLALEAAFALLAEVPRAELELAYREARKHVNATLAETASSHNRLLYFQGMCERLGRSGMGVPLRLYEAYWGAFLEAMVPDAGVYEFLAGLGDARVCLVTDLTAHIQHRKIARLGLERYVHALVTSEEAGREKPHREMFDLALAKVGAAPEEACMIGDNYAKDVRGALTLGITPFWLNRNDEERVLDPGVREVKSFLQLKEHFHA